MSIGFRFNRIVLLLVALATLPLLFGTAFHGFQPCSPNVRCVSEHSPCCPHEHDPPEPERDSTPNCDESCPICDFLAMPRVCATVPVSTVVFDLVQRREIHSERLIVALYQAFEHGRAPPCAV